MSAIVVIPTYNEKDNIKILIAEILQTNPDIHVLVVDDQSPDGTAQIVQELCRGSSRVHLIVRTGNRGIGLADLDGFRYAIKNGFDVVFTMDADFSHDPKYIPQFLIAIKNHDVVIGSRLIKGGKCIRKNRLKNMASSMANLYIRCLLGMAIKDWTSGFRCYRKDVLASLPLEKMVSRGPSLFEEILFACLKRRYDILELPIIFIDRTKGQSKIDLRELIDTLITVLKIRFR